MLTERDRAIRVVKNDMIRSINAQSTTVKLYGGGDMLPYVVRFTPDEEVTELRKEHHVPLNILCSNCPAAVRPPDKNQAWCREPHVDPDDPEHRRLEILVFYGHFPLPFRTNCGLEFTLNGPRKRKNYTDLLEKS